MSYEADSEISFLNGLGKWVERQEVPRLELLKRYLRAMPRRNTWEKINRHEVERHVLMLIEREQVIGATP